MSDQPETRKRGHSSDDEHDTNKRTKPDEEEKIQVRTVVNSRFAGGLIGKGGAVIKGMRADSGGWIDIGDSVRGAQMRVVTAKGTVPQATKALQLLAARMSGLENDAAAERGGEGAEDSDENRAVFLIPQRQVGAIIGKGGAVIKQFREDSGCFVKVSDEALEGSTEKTLTIKGNKEQVATCIEGVVKQLAQNQERSQAQIPFIPMPPGGHQYDPYAGQYGRGGGGGYGAGAYGGHQGGGHGGHGGGYMPQQQQAYGGGGGAYGAPAPDNGQQQTIIIPVPDYLIGTVIGKGGSNIKDVRQRSGSQIRIADLVQGQTDRMVTISGTARSNEIAVALVYEKMNSYDPSRKSAGGQHQAEPNQGF
jgi:transcription antitermination factor NusA-like protein